MADQPADASSTAAPAPKSPAAEEPPRPRNPMPFVIAVILLTAAGWFLVSWMSDTTKLQDCVMSGRKNCAPLDPALGR